jgi:signal transduction histidine kinase
MQRVIDCTTSTGQTHPPAEFRLLEHLVAAYQQFLGHDLPNQLVSIQGMARLLQTDQGVNLDPETRMLLGRLAELTQRADRQARRLADMARLLRDPAWGSPVPLIEVVREALAEVKATPRGCRSTACASDITWDVVEQMPMVHVSPRLLHAVLVELLHNAVAALPADRPRRIEIRAAVVESGCLLTVHDEGGGMSEEELGRLGAVGGGRLGLGFFLVVQAMLRWRGRLTVGSRIDQGTTIALWVPEKEA